jgi:hypothetical protein
MVCETADLVPLPVLATLVKNRMTRTTTRVNCDLKFYSLRAERYFKAASVRERTCNL